MVIHLIAKTPFKINIEDGDQGLESVQAALDGNYHLSIVQDGEACTIEIAEQSQKAVVQACLRTLTTTTDPEQAEAAAQTLRQHATLRYPLNDNERFL